MLSFQKKKNGNHKLGKNKEKKSKTWLLVKLMSTWNCFLEIHATEYHLASEVLLGS